MTHKYNKLKGKVKELFDTQEKIKSEKINVNNMFLIARIGLTLAKIKKISEIQASVNMF